jgi:2-polyprenyl-3-methyl-5-hydroxy-6-metoxy-1,4-benzoquinol methylase
VGIDANPFMIEYAQEKSKNNPCISFEQINIFSQEFKTQKFDFLLCSLFCHHFTDEQLVLMLSQLAKQSKKALIINDLHRNYLAYYGIYILTRVFNGSRLVKNDAPLSVKRAFQYKDSIHIFEKAGIKNYEIRWKWAFRWQIIIDAEK